LPAPGLPAFGTAYHVIACAAFDVFVKRTRPFASVVVAGEDGTV
jgi:hypothetical protein